MFPTLIYSYKQYLMPRSQPAVRATALACLVLRRSYVSNSASPAADWGLKVILQPPYRQRTSLAAVLPPTHWIARRKSHSKGTFNVLAPCLHGTFNVRSPCHRPRVRMAVCVSVPQWHGAGGFKAPLTSVARMVSEKSTRISSSAGQNALDSFVGSPLELLARDSASSSLAMSSSVLLSLYISLQLLAETLPAVAVLWAAYFLLKLMDRPLPSAPFWRPSPSFWVPSPRWADDNAWDYIF